MLKLQRKKRQRTRWEIPPLHLCLSVRLHSNHLPSHGTSRSRLARQPQAPRRDGCPPPGEKLWQRCQWQVVQAAAVCFEKLNIFMKELKCFPLVLTRQVLLKATGTESLDLFRLLSVNNQTLQMEMHTSPYHSVTFYYLSEKIIM